MVITKMNAAVETFAVKDSSGYLCGLVFQYDTRWKIELMRKWIHTESTREQAFAWVRGIMTVLDREAA